MWSLSSTSAAPITQICPTAIRLTAAHAAAAISAVSSAPHPDPATAGKSYGNSCSGRSVLPVRPGTTMAAAAAGDQFDRVRGGSGLPLSKSLLYFLVNKL